jgi:hypothetical protein
MVSSTDFKNTYAYTGLGNYEISFDYDVVSSLIVEWISPAGTISAPKTLGVDYNVIRVGATVQCEVLINFGTDGTIVIRREVPITQTWNGVDGTTPSPSGIMGALDRIVWQVQQVLGRLFGTIRTPYGEVSDMVIPSAAARRGGFFMFQDTPEALPDAVAGLSSVPVSTFMEDPLLADDEPDFVALTIPTLAGAGWTNENVKANAENINSLKRYIAGLLVNSWRSLTIADGDMNGVCYSEDKGMFVAVGGQATNNIQYSLNGTTWVAQTVAQGLFKKVCYSIALGRFVAVGSNASNNLATSLNGTTWAISSIPDGALIGVCYSENKGLFVAVGAGATNNIQYSSNGTTWSQITASPNPQFAGVCYSEDKGLFVAVGFAASNNIQYSSNGTSWTPVTTPNGNLNSVCYSKARGKFVAVGTAASNNVQYSSDGISWTSITIPDADLYSVCYSEEFEVFVAVGVGATNNIQYSYDAISWVQISVTDSDLSDVHFAEALRMFIIVGNGATSNVLITPNMGIV